MKIGRVTEADLPGLAALYQQLLPNDASVEKMREALGTIERNPNQVVLCAKVDGRIVGSLLAVACQMLFGQCRSFLVIEDMVVDAACRRQGVGTALMQEVERFARERNCSYLMLITDTDREGAQRFYQSLGYEADHYVGFKKAL